MSTPFARPGPRPFGNVNLTPKTNLGGIPHWTGYGIKPGTSPAVNLPPQARDFGNPKAALNAYPGIFKLLS